MFQKIENKFIIMAYALMLVGWGGTAVFGILGFTLNNSPWLYIFYLMGGWSPTIASYWSSKKQGSVTGLLDWLKQIFIFKSSIVSYGLVIFLLTCYFFPLCTISGFTRELPLYNIVLMLPMMFMGGGLEETGWRYILQPEYEKKYNFVTANILTGIIWAVWHFPLFHIVGVAQYHTDFLIFFINVLGLTFALGAIRSVTQNIWLCILFHTLANAIQSVFIIKQTILGVIISTIFLIIISLIIKTVCTKIPCSSTS